jgi:uncharacterized protein (DUF362 family)
MAWVGMMSQLLWRWLCIAGLLALLLGARAAQSLAVLARSPSGMALVALARTVDGVEAAVRQAVAQAGGLEGIIAPGDVVAIKVNLVMDAPAASGMVTDPAVARAVVRLAREAGAARVIIVEGTAQYRDGDLNRDRHATRAAFLAAGYDADGDMVDDVTGAPLIDLNDSGGTDVADPARVSRVVVPTGLIRKEYWLPNSVLDADVLISVPVLKNHYLAGVTLGMKNLVGLLPADLYHAPGNVYGKHSLSHSPIELDQHIVDLNLARRPDFVVVDGQRGMIDGPVGSQLADPPLGLILAGADVVAVDTVGALLMGYDPRAIPYLEMAARSGLGIADVAHIRVTGVPLAQVRRDFPAPYADSPVRRADRQPPVLSLSAPEQVELPDTLQVAVQASDNDALARVELFLDGKRVGQALSSPYTFTLEGAAYDAGTHLLLAIAYDRSLNQAEAAREIRLQVATPTPVPLPTSTVTPSPSPSPTPSPQPPTATATPSPRLPTATATPSLQPATVTALPSHTPPPPTIAEIVSWAASPSPVAAVEGVPMPAADAPAPVMPAAPQVAEVAPATGVRTLRSLAVVTGLLAGCLLGVALGLWLHSRRT